ncbi:preprotein translocase subunit YajC [Francisellaceae bacterium]|nr:preprotein translocase subunit YajC [Francisellaceae bacterium]
MKKLLAILASNLLAFSAFAAEPAAQGSGYESILLLVVFFAIFYFLLIRPQMKRNKEHKKLLGGIAKGDEVVTTSGIVGKIAKIGDAFIDLTIADGVEIKVQKQSVNTVLPKGSMNSNN